MFWKTYGRVVGALIAVGVGIGAGFGILFPFLVPPDAGEDDLMLRVVLAVWGAAFGGVVAAVAAVSFAIVVGVWAGDRERSAGSRGWMGALGAGAGAAAAWIVFGALQNNPYAWGLWVGLAIVSGALAALVAGPLTMRAARRAASSRTAGAEPSGG